MQIAHLTNELSIARGAIESLSADVSARDASLLAAAAEVEAARASEASRSQAAEEAVHQVNDAQAEIGARDGRIAALQAELDASKRASIDLSGEKDLLVGKLTGESDRERAGHINSAVDRRKAAGCILF